jgi:rare lipoprotein A
MQKLICAGLIAYLLPMAVAGQSKTAGGHAKVAAPHSPHNKAAVRPIKVQYGTASFYANKFEGRKTYTDEIFSQKKLSAASNTLPMHTWIRVTNLRNHRSVVLRINDRMHPRNKRLIDLSRAAADKLRYTARGLTKVRIDVLGRKRPSEAEMAVNKEN